MPSPMIDLTGQEFGHWTVLRFARTGGGAIWLCRCECGAEREIQSGQLRGGHTSSCRECSYALRRGTRIKYPHNRATAEATLPPPERPFQWIPALPLAALIPGHWVDDALCAQTDPEAFFPEKGGSPRIAKRICERCDVRAQCLEYALDHDERFGIWGGKSERERRRMKKAVLAFARR